MRTESVFVLDGSVTMAWFFDDEEDEYASLVHAELESGRAVVPSLWPLEVANAVVVGERKRRSTEALAASWLKALSLLSIEVDDETTARAWGDTLHLARSQNLSAYDASYLELAMRRNLPLATLDNELRNAALDWSLALCVDRDVTGRPMRKNGD